MGIKELPKSHVPGTIVDRVVLRSQEVQRFQIDAEIYRKRNRVLVTMPALLVGNELGKTGQVATEDSPLSLKTLGA